MSIAHQQRKEAERVERKFRHPTSNKHPNAHIKVTNTTHERPGHQMPSLENWDSGLKIMNIASRDAEKAGFNPRGGTGGGNAPQVFQLPPQAYDTINNPSPALPNVPPPPQVSNFAPSRTHVYIKPWKGKATPPPQQKVKATQHNSLCTPHLQR